MEIPKSFLGYKRENGRVGTRNHVIIVPLILFATASAQAFEISSTGKMIT